MAQLRPTFSESWYRVANLKARLRGSTQISRQYYRGERWYVVRDPAGNQFHRLSSAAYKFVGLLDGSRTVGEAWELVGGQLDDAAPTQPEVIQILSQLHAANLLDADIAPDAGVLLRRHKQLQKQKLQGRLMNILFPRFPLWDPDRFLKRWMPIMRVLLSKFGAVLWIVVIAAGVFQLVGHITELKDMAGKSLDPGNWPMLWATFVIIKLIHELGHAFACRRFGGEVHELGVMFLVFMPAPYVDASTAWGLPSRWARMFVGAGGMIFELFVASIMAFVWVKTPGSPVIHQLAYNTMLIASVSTVIFNANPLLRYDGYYILSDLLEIPNLSQKAKDYSLGLIKRHLFGVKSPIPLPPPGQRFWLFIYAVTSGVYRIFVGIAIIFIVTDKVPILGPLMALGGVVTWLVVPIFKTANYLLLDAELHRKRWRAGIITAAFVAIVVFAVGAIPTNVHFESQAILEPADRDTVRAQTEGFVRSLGPIDGPPVKDGQQVKAGDVILVLENDELDNQVTHLQKERDEINTRVRASQAIDQAQHQIDVETLANKTEELADAKQRQDALLIRAGISGTLIAPRIEELMNRHLQRGEQVAIVANIDKLQATGLLGQDDGGLAFKKSPPRAEIRLAGLLRADYQNEMHADILNWGPAGVSTLKDRSLTKEGGGPAELDPQDPEHKRLLVPMFEVKVQMDNPNGTYYPGQRCLLRFTIDEKHTLAWQWGRHLLQVIQSHGANSKWL